MDLIPRFWQPRGNKIQRLEERRQPLGQSCRIRCDLLPPAAEQFSQDTGTPCGELNWLAIQFRQILKDALRQRRAGTGERGGWQFPENRFVFAPEADLAGVMGGGEVGW
jgi:hypothetical protein